MKTAILNLETRISTGLAGIFIIAEIVHKAGILFRAWQRRRRERAELAMLSDVELAELWMTRADVGGASQGPFWSPPRSH